VTNSIHQDRAVNFDQNDLIDLIPQMRGFARALCRDRAEADDLAQDALASAWRCRDSYISGTNMKAWVFTIIRNQFYSHRRRSWRMCQLDPTVAEETLVSVSNPTAALELEDVRRAMLELCDEQREALTLIAVAGLAHSEAALICKCAEGTIKSRVSRARQKLAAILARGDLLVERQLPSAAMATLFADAARACSQAAA
jgi:RNA polymerase sigma-70 factor (ECF subfamily)